MFELSEKKSIEEAQKKSSFVTYAILVSPELETATGISDVPASKLQMKTGLAYCTCFG